MEDGEGLPQSQYRQRLVDAALDNHLSQLSAVSLVGPRACGKTTTAARHVATTVQLGRPAEAGLFRADPDAALRRQTEPVLLDEWQEVPAVLGAVKRSVDADPRPGRFILTGSISLQSSTDTWPGTGRVVPLPVFPMTQREIQGQALDKPSFVDRLRGGKLDQFAGATSAFDINDYLTMISRGGFPDAVLGRSVAGAELWLAGYATQLAQRDARLVRQGLDPERFTDFLEAVAACTASVIREATLLDAVRIDRRTADAYWWVLENLFIAEALPAWWSSRLTRLVALKKRYLIDSALAIAVMRLSVDAITRDIDLVGRLLDTWVAAQLRPEAALSDHRPRLHHLRTKSGQHEVDLLVEFGGGLVAGVEVKATASPARDDARHLCWLRDQLGSRFLMGVVLHTGPFEIEMDDRIVAAPLSTLWA